jgi:DNA polymerase-4
VEPERTILHVDMDAFFAAIEQLDRPELRGKPLLIGHDGPRGVVTTASYEARPFGCRSAQPMAVAKRLCPQAIVVPVRGERYREVSGQLFQLLESYSPLVEPISVDEAFVDLTGTERLFGSAEATGRRLKDEIRETLGLTASVGIAPNKFIAKIASDYQKPDGLTIVPRDGVDAFLGPLPIRKLWGVGPRTAERMDRMSIRLVGDLRRYSEKELIDAFGKEGAHFARLARGEDDRPVTPDCEAKSIGHEQTFGSNLEDPEYVLPFLLRQVELVAARLRRHGFYAGGVTVKIRFGQFQTITRAGTLSPATNLTKPIWAAVRAIFTQWADTSFQPVRLIGATATHLSHSTGQLALFESTDESRQARVDEAADAIAGKFGKHAIRRGGTIGPAHHDA